VRRINSVLEILSGHNRVEASKIAGHAEIPTITLENVADDDALVIVIETNLIQRSFSDMSHSEKAAVLALHHSRLFSQGKRNDILIQLEMLDNPHEHNDNKTCSQVAHKLKSRDVVAKEYGLSKDTVARYLRINRLNLPLKKQLDDGGIAFMSAVILSYLDDAEQKLLADCLAKHNLTVDMKKADMLRKYSEKNRLDSDSIYRILSGSLSHKPIRTPTVKISKAVFVKYFNSNQSAKEIQAIVEKALAMYYEHNETKPSAENSKEATK
jgi:ParB family chromosome partitioning protein